MTRPDVEPLRQSYHRAPVRELLVRARGFELNSQRRLQPCIEARILSFGSARTLYHFAHTRMRHAGASIDGDTTRNHMIASRAAYQLMLKEGAALGLSVQDGKK